MHSRLTGRTRRPHLVGTVRATRTATLSLVLLGTVALTACDDDDDPVAPATTAQLRVVHASPDAPNVDVLVDNAPALTNVPFKAASNYLEVPAGARNLKVRATGTTTVVIDQNATVTDGSAYTVLATGRLTSIAPLVLQDNLTNPGTGNIKLRLVHAAPTAGNVDIYVTAPGADIATATPTVANVPFRGASSHLEVPAGTYRVRITPVGTKTVAISDGTGAGYVALAMNAAGAGWLTQARTSP